jgi:hypothetical protein
VTDPQSDPAGDHEHRRPTDGRPTGTGSGRSAPSVFAWLFRNRRTGQITIAQFPNVALWLFFITVVLRRIVATGSTAHTAVDWAGAVTLGGWAVDEVLRGVNPWRRFLGAAVGVVVVAGVVSLAG